MRLSLVYLAVFAAPSLVHGRRHKCSRSTPLSSAAATPDTSSGWTSTPSASVSPSSVIIASSSTPILSDSSAATPSASASTPGSDVPSTFSTATTPAGTPSSSDVSVTPSSTDISATPSSTDVSATPSSSLSSPSLGVSSSASETPIASTTPDESTTLITQTTPSASAVSTESTTPVSSTVPSSSSSSSAPAATPTGWQLQSTANSGYPGSYLLGYEQYHSAPYFFSPEASPPDFLEKLDFYIEPGTGHLFWVSGGVNNRYQFYTSYDEFNEIGEYYYNVNPGSVSVYDMTVGVTNSHTEPLVCSRTGASFSCSTNTPAGVFSHFMVRSGQSSEYTLYFGSSVPSGWQEVTFAAVDVY